MPAAETELDEGRAPRVVRWLIQAWVFLLVLALYPYTANPASPIKNLVTGWSAFAICATYLFAVMRERLPLRLGGGTFALLGVFLGVHLLSAVCSDYPANSLYSLRFWLGAGLIALMAGNAFRTADQVWRLMLSVVLAVSVSSIYGYVQKFGLDPFPWSARNIEEYAGMPSTYANPNFAGHTLLLVVLMAGALLYFNRKWICVPALTLIASHLYLTHMRGARVGLLAAVALVGLYLVLRKGGLAPLRAAVLPIAALLILGAGALAGALAYANMKAEGALPLDTPSVLRLNGYYGAARMALERPLLGVGPGNYDLESPRLWTPYEQRWFASEGKKNDHVHNDALEAAAEAGFPGAALYFAVLFWGVIGGLVLAGAGDENRRQIGLVLAACFAAFAVDGLFGFNLRVPVSAGLFFLLLGVLGGLLHGPSQWRMWHVPAQLVLTLIALGLAVASTLGFVAESRYQEARGAQSYAEKSRAAGDVGQMTYGYDAGLKLLARGAAWMPFDARFPQLEGQLSQSLGRLEDADAAFGRAADLSPFNPSIYAAQAQVRASIALRRDELDVFDGAPDAEVVALAAKAEEAARRALALCPVLPAAEEVIGRLAFARAAHEPGQKAARLKEACDALEGALRHGARNDAEDNRILGRVRQQLGDAEAAIAAYRRAVEDAPGNEELWEEFAAFAVREQRAKVLADALNAQIARARNAAKRDTALLDNLTLRLAYFEVYSLRSPAIGRSLAREVAVRSPGNAGAWGLAAVALGDTSLAHLHDEIAAAPAGAVPEWLRGMAEQPKGAAFVAAVNAVADAAEEESAPKAVVSRTYTWAAHALMDAFPQAELVGEQMGRAAQGIGEIYYHCGRWTECAEAAQFAALALPPEESPRAFLLLAEALGKLKRHTEALAAAQQAAAAWPHVVTRAALARELAAVGRLAEAHFEFSSLVKTLPQDIPNRDEMLRDAARVEARVAAKERAK